MLGMIEPDDSQAPIGAPVLADETVTYVFSAPRWSGIEEQAVRVADLTDVTVVEINTERRLLGLRERVTATVTGQPKELGHYQAAMGSSQTSGGGSWWEHLVPWW